MSSIFDHIPALPDLPSLLNPLSFTATATAGKNVIGESPCNLKISKFPRSADDAEIIAMMGGAFGRGADGEQFRKLIFYKSPCGDISILLKFATMHHVN